MSAEDQVSPEPIAEPAAPWAVDEVSAVIQRAYPDPVSKEELQERVGAGASDLRAALAFLEGNDHVTALDHGYLWLEEEAGVIAGVIAQGFDGDPEYVPPPSEPEDDPDSFPPGEAVEEPEEELPPGADARTADTRYSMTVVLEIDFYPELREGEEDDAGAIRESHEIALVVPDGVLTAYPDLPTRARIVKVEAFDKPRRVWPVR